MTPGADVYNDAIFIDTIQSAALTASVVSQGVVLGYMYSPTGLADGDSAVASVNDAYVNYLGQIIEPGQIILYSSIDFTGYKYRFVIIPGSIAITDASGQSVTYTRAQIKAMTYSTMSNTFRIPAAGGTLKAGAN